MKGKILIASAAVAVAALTAALGAGSLPADDLVRERICLVEPSAGMVREAENVRR